MVHAARNAKIAGGIMKFSRSKMYHKKAAFVKNKTAVKKVAAAKVTKSDEYWIQTHLKFEEWL